MSQLWDGWVTPLCPQCRAGQRGPVSTQTQAELISTLWCHKRGDYYFTVEWVTYLKRFLLWRLMLAKCSCQHCIMTWWHHYALHHDDRQWLWLKMREGNPVWAAMFWAPQCVCWGLFVCWVYTLHLTPSTWPHLSSSSFCSQYDTIKVNSI